MFDWIGRTFDLLANLSRTVDWRMAAPIVGSLAAAFFGAYTAQRIIERRETRQNLSKEIRSTSAATTLSIHIANTFIAMKKQHIKRLHESYHQNKKEVLEVLKSPPINGRRPEFHYKADLEYLPVAELPTEHLQRIVADELSVVARPLLLPFMIRQVVRSQADAVIHRNRLVDEFKKANLSLDEFAAKYFGLNSPRGVDNVYGATLDGIYTYTDDCIYFSIRLTNDLLDHARGLQKKYEARYKEKAPSVTIADFSKVEKGLLPLEGGYADWEKMASRSEQSSMAQKSFWRRWTRRSAT